mmetsp:Transcript_19729/g.23553  ORF Transcript_19729/g.23553 Transcript_19729/m.23553 type:complete len:222 (+) Transcript_19729:120-785(+)|eukprot:CAMPEP_0198254944 /NCGR_PEP_ID=MMETSP1447-20131203/5184_1 /TAXON_ID=420782 /ORGANISM="Chaetoceros dichaeta, Strain CCMP1751" /LENGTH=221 /DNA_ID=CAMNT_0043941197 /DNA_START=102 /DNA_END=767 /DNA_ORIENTATION=+
MMSKTFLLLITATALQSTSHAFSTSQSGEGRRAFLQNVGAAVASAMVVTQTSPAWAAIDSANIQVGGKVQLGEESIMAPKAHGTSEKPVQESLKYNVSNKLADRISNYNRQFAEQGGYFESTTFEKSVRAADGPLTYYDSVTGKALFVAPINRSVDDFIKESKIHGWPSFRDEEVVWDNVRVLRKSGETVSIDGTHLGHNLPDRTGNRYCINLVSVAGNPV